MKKFKIGDKVRVTDHSWSFGFVSGVYSYGAPHTKKDILTVKRIGLRVLGDIHDPKDHATCDLIVADEKGNRWFAISRLCELADKKIELRYFVDGVDKTDSISDETKRNLRNQ